MYWMVWNGQFQLVKYLVVKYSRHLLF